MWDFPAVGLSCRGRQGKVRFAGVETPTRDPWSPLFCPTKLPKGKNFWIYVPARLVKLAQQAGPLTVEVVEVVALDLHPEAQ